MNREHTVLFNQPKFTMFKFDQYLCGHNFGVFVLAPGNKVKQLKYDLGTEENIN